LDNTYINNYDALWSVNKRRINYDESRRPTNNSGIYIWICRWSNSNDNYKLNTITIG